MKRIVVCADGTWNIRDQVDKKTNKRHATNVTKVARAIVPRSAEGIEQVVYYHDGVGTRRGLDKLTGGAFGHGIENNIREIYRFIAYTTRRAMRSTCSGLAVGRLRCAPWWAS